MTLDEAAQYLSLAFEDSLGVTKDDILQYALDGEIALSLEFVQPVEARVGYLAPKEESIVPNDSNYWTIDDFTDTLTLAISQRIVSIEGVWTICLQGAGRQTLRYLRRPDDANNDLDDLWNDFMPICGGLILRKEQRGETSYVQLAHTSLHLCNPYEASKHIDPTFTLSNNLVVCRDKLNRFIKNNGDEEPAPKTRNVLLRLILALSEHIYERPIKQPHKASPLILSELTLKDIASKDIELPTKRKFGDFLADAIRLRG